MNRVLQGRDSDVYQRFKQVNLVEHSFSIVYHGEITLDLVAKSPQECKMWVKCLRELIKRAGMNQKLTSITKIWINGINYVPKNRPKRELRNLKIIRPNNVPYERWNIDSKLDAKNKSDVEQLRKRYNKLVKLANSSDVRNLKEHVNLMKSVAAIGERLEELVVETRCSKDSHMSKRDIWTSSADIETLEEKAKVLQKNNDFILR